MTRPQVPFSRMALAWIESDRGASVSTGLDPEEASRLAAGIMENLRVGKEIDESLSGSETAPDILHALTFEIDQALLSGFVDASVPTSAYELISRLDWQDDEFQEKDVILGCLAYLGWRQSVKEQQVSHTVTWERKAGDHLAGHESVLLLIEGSTTRWSPDICDRFLTDQAILLAVAVHLRGRVSRFPGPTLRQASSIHQWLLTQALDATPSTHTLLGWFAWLAGFAALQCGLLEECRRWLEQAAIWCEKPGTCATLIARTKYLAIGLAHGTRSWKSVIHDAPEVVRFAVRIELRELAAKARFVEAQAFKETSREAEAELLLRALRSEACVLQDPSLHGLVLLALAELAGRKGDYEGAMGLVNDARPLIEASDAAFASAHLHNAKGEILRDRGELNQACDSFLIAAEVYSKAEMASFAAYTRVVLADTLIAAGREQEALAQILAALPVIEKRALAQEAVAAVALLRESLRRQSADPRALRVLREQLDRMRREGRS